MTIFDSNTDKVVSDNELARLGLSSTSPVLRQLGYYPLVYDIPEYDVATQSIEFDGQPRLNEDGTEYVQHYIAVTLSGDAALSSLEAVRTAKFADFDRVFQHLDQLKIRPASSITEAISKGQTPDPGDVYVLDGMVWNIDEQHPPIPRHPRCRCLLLPRARSWRDFGIDIPELDAVARPWVIREPGPIGAGGKKILYAGTTKENFGGWWATLPREQQVQSIGPVRTDLIREGKLEWGDLVEKGSGHLRPHSKSARLLRA